MKNIFKSLLLCGAFVLLAAPMTSCSKDEADSGISGIEAPSGNTVSEYGETVTLKFNANNAWEASLATSDGGTWARINNMSGNTVAGQGSIRLTVDSNGSGTERSVDVYVNVTGHGKSLLCTLKQPASSISPELTSALNEYMHKQLKENYLWHTDYAALEKAGKIDMTVPYDQFLYTNLTKMGETNIEDGGYYRAYSALSGKRYIYSYIDELAPGARASSKIGLGLGPSFATMFDDKGTIVLLIGYVYPGSPAEKAGMKRGDCIFSVNGAKLNNSNYSQMQNTLFYSTSGTYKTLFYRWEKDSKGNLELTQGAATITAQSFAYNPVLMAGVIESQPHISPAYKIGYLVLESFDGASHDDVLIPMLTDFKNQGITDLILDLRFNPGGALVECRYLLSSIVGPANYDKTMANLTFNDGSKQKWTFGYGPDNIAGGDGLGQGPDLGLKRLFVICSENTGSASEVVINALEGIDFPITTYGSRTEGKNVGMEAKEVSVKGRKFEFAPITFRMENAKDFGDYADGFMPDKVTNNQNSSMDDDIEPYFPYLPADWGDTNDQTFYWALINCIDGKDPDFEKSGVSAKSAFSTRKGAAMPNIRIKPEMGRFGTIVYSDEVVELGK